MTQQIINTGSGPNAQDGDNLYVAFTKVNENFSNIWTQGPVDSNISISNNAIISTDVNGNIVLMPNGIGYAQINASTIPGANNTYFLGDSARRWRGIWAGSAGINTTGNLYAGNLIISGNTTYSGDITFNGNVGVAQTLSVVGNITGDQNLLVSGELTAGPATFGGNVAITGNLQVAGNIIYIDVEELRVHDPVIELGTGPNGTPLTSSDGFSRGVLMDYFNTVANTQQYGFMGLAGPNYTTYQFLTNATDVGNTFTGTPANLTFGNATASGILSAAGNIIGGNIVTIGNVSSSANITGANLLTGGNISAAGGLIADTFYANTSIESGNIISAAGNITGAYILGNGRYLSGIDTTLISNGTSRVQIVTADGNIIANVAGNTIATWTANGYSVTGNINTDSYYTGNGRFLTGVVADSIGNALASLTVTGNTITGNLNTNGQVSAAGNVTGNYILGNGALLTGVITSVANINNGTSNVSINVANGNITMAVNGVADIVEVSTSGVYINGTISTTGNAIVNGILTDGYYYANGQPLDMQQPAGSNTWVQYNNNNDFGASDAFTFDGSANALVVSGNISGGNLRTTGLVSATGNITGGNLRTTGAVVGGTGSFLSDVTIYGNLQVGGNIVYVDVTELRVVDPVIEMGGGPNGTPLTADDGFSRGLKLDYFNDTANAAQFGFFGLAATDFTTYQFLTNATDTANTFTGIAANLYFGNASATGNIVTAGILTDNYYYANGQPIDMQQPAGSNTQIQFNNNNDFGASANLTFDSATNQLSLNGIINVLGNSVTGANSAIFGIPGHTSLANTIVQVTGNSTQFTQVNFQNLNPVGSTDWVATSDNGNDDQFYINMGINGSTFSDPDFEIAGPNDGYLYVAGSDPTGYANDGNLVIGSISGNVKVFTGNTTQQSIVAIFSDQSFELNGAFSASGTITGTNFYGTGVLVTDQIQGNSFSGQSFTGNVLSMTGNITTGGIKTNNYYYANGQPIDMQQPAGSNTQIQFNNNNDFGASANLTFDSATNALTVNGIISSTGNLTSGNLLTSGLISATGNITAGNIIGTFVAPASNTQVLFNDAGIIAGNNQFTFNKVGNTLTVGTTGGTVSAAYVSTPQAGVDLTLLPSTGITRSYGNLVPQFANTYDLGGSGTRWNNFWANVANIVTLNTVGNINGGNLLISGIASTTGNITGGNISTSGNATVGGILTNNYYYANGQPLDMQQPAGSNTQIQFNNTGDFGATANLTFDSATNQFYVNGVGSFVGNIVGGNLRTAGIISATGNIDGANLSGEYIIGTLTTAAQTNITSVGTLTSLNSGAISSSGNVTGANLLTGGQVSAAGNVTGNVLIGNVISSVGNAYIGGNLYVTGNVTYINITDLNVQDPIISMGRGPNNTPLTVNDGFDRGEQLWYYTDQEYSAFIGWDNSTNNLIAALDVTNSGEVVTVNNWGNFVVGNLYTQALNSANLLFVNTSLNVVTIGNSTVTAGATFAVNATNSMLIPVGNTFQRPGTPAVGMVRFNTTLDAFEYYSSVDGWTQSGSGGATSLTSQTFTADGSTVIFTLTNASTTVDSLVMINGVTQIPTSSYSIVGTTLTFTESPEAGDTIEVREIVAQSTVHAITNSSGNSTVSVDDAAAQVNIIGNLIPDANVTYNLGSSTRQWNDLYLSGNTIYIGGNTLSVASGNLTFNGNIVSDYVYGNGAFLTGIATSYGNANVVANLAALGSNPISTAGNITGGNLSIAGNVVGDIAFTGGNVFINNNAGAGGSDEGGQINFAAATANSTLSGPIALDIYQNKMRFFETAGTNRGMYIDLANAMGVAGSSNGVPAIGYRDVPQVSFSANATAAASDAGKHYYSTTAGNLAITLPDNSNVAFSTGATLTIVVNAAGNVLVNAAAGVTLYMAGSSTAGNRVVGSYGLASVMKVAANTWVISGTGVY